MLPDASNGSVMAGAGMGGEVSDQQEDQQSSATKASAYVKPDGQPTICANCSHFDGSGSCDHPEVIADPEVNGKVEANGHSKFFNSKQSEANENEGADTSQPNYQSGAAQLAAGARFRGPGE